MIEVTVWKAKDQYRGFLFRGHAGYREEGEDILCAAVSALALNTANSIEAFTDDYFEQELSEDGGYLRMSFTRDVSEATSLLMNSLLLGIQNIQAEYGMEYITLTFEEV
ncbi:MAG: ribosomal-processing cysteine protease Prp [Lachnospiraceae bacterium]|nr:ribosomal-processing cysteine protease Prp [Lachnospiraceae bacterium]